VFAATTQFLIVMVAGWLNEGIQKQLEHALLECRVLREVIGTKRIPLSDNQRRRHALSARKLTPAQRRKVATIVQPETSLNSERLSITTAGPSHADNGSGVSCASTTARPPDRSDEFFDITGSETCGLGVGSETPVAPIPSRGRT
jgi:hypothetical protein